MRAEAECSHFFQKKSVAVHGKLTNLSKEKWFGSNCQRIYFSIECRHVLSKGKLFPLDADFPFWFRFEPWLLPRCRQNLPNRGGNGTEKRQKTTFINLKKFKRINPAFVKRLTIKWYLKFHFNKQACWANSFFKTVYEIFI